MAFLAILFYRVIGLDAGLIVRSHRRKAWSDWLLAAYLGTWSKFRYDDYNKVVSDYLSLSGLSCLVWLIETNQMNQTAR